MTEQQREEVLQANLNFYSAVRKADYESMESVWAKDESAKCVHPGWPMLHGWEAVSLSWKNIFENGAPLDIELRDIEVQISGELAWVICIEKISYEMGGEIHAGFAQSTNIFKLQGSNWLLELHHASPIPAPLRDVSPDAKLQ